MTEGEPDENETVAGTSGEEAGQEAPSADPEPVETVPVAAPEPAEKVPLPRPRARGRPKKTNKSSRAAPAGIQVAPAPPPAAAPPPAGPEREARPEGFGLDFSQMPGDNSPTDRLKRVLQHFKMGGKDGPKLKEFIIEYWGDTPPIQNPWALFDFLSKLPGTGGSQVANIIVNFVFGGGPPHAAPGFPNYGPPGGVPGAAPPYGAPYGPAFGAPAAAPAAVPEPHEDDYMQDFTKRMMEEMMMMVRVRNMAQAFAPVLGGAGADGLTLEARPRRDPETGTFLTDEHGQPVFEYVPHTASARDTAGLIDRYQRGEPVDPTAAFKSMVDVFKTGVQMGGGGQAGESSQVQALQQQLIEAQIGEVKAHYASTEKMFERERTDLLRRLDEMSPENQAAQLQRFKDMGLVGGDKNLDAVKLEMRMRMWEIDREDQKDAAAAEGMRKERAETAGRAQFHELVDLGKTALTDAVQPVLKAVGDGIEQRLAGGGPIAPQAPQQAQAPQPRFDPRTASPQEREVYRQRLGEIETKLRAEQERLAAAEREAPAPAAPGRQAPPAEPAPYGDYGEPAEPPSE